MLVRHVDPKVTRAFFNTRVMGALIKKHALNKDRQYNLRKELSVALIFKVLSVRDANAFLAAFPDCHRDAVESLLLAAWVHQAPVPRPVLETKPPAHGEKRIRQFSATLDYENPKLLKLDDREREEVVGAFTGTWRGPRGISSAVGR